MVIQQGRNLFRTEITPSSINKMPGLKCVPASITRNAGPVASDILSLFMATDVETLLKKISVAVRKSLRLYSDVQIVNYIYYELIYNKLA